MDDPTDTRRDRSDASGRRRRWTGLETATGFERCVRETLRELYGYVALLVGRDRDEAERRVADVYRSLFRSVRSGHTDEVSLGALRSVARRSWLDDHFIEIVSVFEVAGDPVATISELSTLERATIVLRHVNEMTVEAVALELGRSERDVAAVDTHAVRRLRGTDEASGAWIRAYLGPSVTPTPGLIDRIIDRLADEHVERAPELGRAPVPESVPVHESVPVPESVPESVVDPVEVPVPESVPASVVDPVEVPVPEPVPEPESLPEPESVVDPVEVWRPERVAEPESLPESVVDPVEVWRPERVPEPESVVDPVEVWRPESLSEPDASDRRPRWVVAVGVVLLVALVGAVAMLLARGSGDTTIAVTVTTVQVATTTTEPVVAASVPTTEPLVDTVTAGGFEPQCSERFGGAPATVTWPTEFGALGREPTLTVGLPRSVDATSGETTLPVSVVTVIGPDGLVLAVRTDERAVERTLLASIGLDGTVRWIRCLAGRIEIGAVAESGIPLALRDPASGDEWTLVSPDDGSATGPADPVQRALLDAAAGATAGTTAGVTAGTTDGDVALGFSYDGGSGRSVLAGIDEGAGDGRVLWTAPDLVIPDDGGFRYAVVDDVVVVRSCPDPLAAGVDDLPSFVDCPDGALVALDLASGDQRWIRPGDHAVAVIADGVALVGSAAGWEMVEVASGATVADRRWDDPTTFPLGADLGSVRRVGGALVVTTALAVNVWLPDGVGGPGVAFDLP